MDKKGLLIIDYTNDFVDENGSLTLGKPAQQCEDKILSLANQYLKNGDYVFLPTDIHNQEDNLHPEHGLFPIHNQKKTWGRDFFGELKNWYQENKDNKLVIMIDKTRYSSFAGTNLDILLRERNIKELCLTGVATDICLLHTAIDAYNLNYQLEFYEDAMSGFSKENEIFAKNHFKTTLNAKIN
ncbi:isochorismatase family protein [Lactobacillus sp. S2-2]|uniref:isochorismatase family cysteine hydrolase n=1 Tax=Lactobacillus sp. S2-2 TaxID=2692917 RepID=UPI001F2B6BD5|nr:isochorismatase family protein [Lactobacillus sp. S2-2]